MMTLVGVVLSAVIPLADGDDALPTVMYSEDVVAAVLADAGIDVATVGISATDLNLFDNQQPRTPLLEWILASPLKMPLLTSYFEDTFRIDWPGECVDAFAQLSRWRGRVVRRGLVGDALERATKLAAGDAPVVSALERLFSLGDKSLSEDQRKTISTGMSGATPQEQTRLAVLLHVMCDAHQWSQMAYEGRSEDEWSAILRRERRSAAESEKPKDGSVFDEYRSLRRSVEAVREFDVALPLVGAEEIALAVEEFVAPFIRTKVEGRRKRAKFGSPDGRSARRLDAGTMNTSEPPPEDEKPQERAWSLVLHTPLGLISIGSEHDLDGETMAPFLLIDWGGDDEYSQLAANTAPIQRVSVAIDLGGNDRYVRKQGSFGGFGAGHCGIGMLFDFDGNDVYEINRNGLGQALFGVGLLYDSDGDDEYLAVESSQAHAVAGVAMLVDLAGDDTYEIYSTGQGFGGPGGAAALVDRAGSDRYKANDADIRFPSPQSSKHNVSLAQGAGSGWRGDYQQGLSAAGGVGVLFDEAGNDIYFCGVFGQGVGYWFGSGLLIDVAGHDQYTGQWYVQGASAHFAVGVLLDTAGNDRYSAAMSVSQGAGHDVGLGALFDLAGDDRYRCGTLALGAGNAGGVGILLDKEGNDSYLIENNERSCLGYVTPAKPTSIRKVIQGIGLFLDLGGVDGYTVSRASNNAAWKSITEPPSTVLPGVARGIDREIPARAEK